MKHVSPPSVFEALKAGAREAAASKKSCVSSRDKTGVTSQNPSKNNRFLHIKQKRITQESFSPIPESPFDIQKRDLKNPFSRKVEVHVNVDEFVSNLMKEPSSFEPNSAAWWEDGDKVPFLFLAKVFDLIKGESGRNIITGITCNVLRNVIAKTPDDLLEVIYLLANKIAPAHQGLNLRIGDALLIKALAQACGTSQEAVKILYREIGDLGDVAKAIRSKQSLIFQPPPLTITKVFNTFRHIAQAKLRISLA